MQSEPNYAKLSPTKLSDHSLHQLDECYINSLEDEELRHLTLQLLEDLREARERLNQTARNSSRPPSSQAPFESNEPTPNQANIPSEPTEVPEPSAASEPQESDSASSDTSEPDADTEQPKKKRGKPKGATGFGRTQVFKAERIEVHHPSHCAGCGRALDTVTGTFYTGFQELDIVWRDGTDAALGIQIEVIDHRLSSKTCCCGHTTQARWGTGEVDAMLQGIELSEWRLVGPGLATLIVALHKRFRMSYARIEEFLEDWLGIEISRGVLCQTVLEASAAIAPVEEELVAAVQESELLHADETPWKESGQLLWLWVFTTSTTTLYYVAGRGRELLDNLLEGFQGCLMSDGWQAYRHLEQRLRCWAHLLRKAQGLKESYTREAQQFGHLVDDFLSTLIDAIYEARGDPPTICLLEQHANALEQFRQACETHRGCSHQKTHALAVEFLNDWDAIFKVLEHPAWPLTNNAAERALRHWVMLRKISQGTRSATGSRSLALLASVIDTCRQRGHSPWDYLRSAIRDRRAGLALPALPQ